MVATALAAIVVIGLGVAAAWRESAGKWTYSEHPNKAGGSDYYARVTSSRQGLSSKPETTMDMTLSHTSTMPLDVTLEVSSGDLMCPSFAGCSGTVRFDEGPEQPVTFQGFLESRTDTMFLRDPEPFVGELARAKRVTIAKEMLGAGTQRFQFDVSGLRWRH